ncbi:MAG: hypothetical protein Q8J78_15630 [Moraxellaceae bacterium]|nr:hypothetical protein [Moraxellaceae bacterium]
MTAKKVFFLKLVLATLLVIAFAASIFSSQYDVLLISLSVVCALGLFLEKGFILLAVVLGVYLIIGFAPISLYRGEMKAETVSAYILFIFPFYLSILFLSWIRDRKVPSISLAWGGRAETIFYAHMLVVWSGTVYVYVAYGNVFLNQDGRFFINPLVGYVVKSGLYAAIYVACVRRLRSFKDFFVYVFLPIAPTILIGSRGNVVAYVMAVGLYYFLISGRVSIKGYAKSVAVIMLVFFVVTGIFYLRRSGEGAFITVDELIYSYFHDDGYVSYILAPFHVAFRETIGLANRVITVGIVNEVTSYPLFVADMVTVLPGEQVAAGRALGEMMGVIGDGGLTPGLIGGIFLDYGHAGVIFAAVMLGLVLAFLRKLSTHSHYWLIVFCVTIAQFVHLFHRGFVKPEYFLSYLIIYLYYHLTAVREVDKR